MFTVEAQALPAPDRTAEAVSLMAETLAEVAEARIRAGVMFSGEVFQETDDPDRYRVATYCGRVTSMVMEPPSFNLLVEEAWLQTAPCACPGPDMDLVFTDFEQAMEAHRIDMDLEAFAGVATVDPHYQAIALAPHTEMTVRFDRLGAYGAYGVVRADDAA